MNAGLAQLITLTDSGDHGDALGLLPPQGYSPAARRLLNGAMGAWVFGGMGSWNDTGPRDSAQIPRYEELSRNLFEAIMNGLVAAANAYL